MEANMPVYFQGNITSFSPTQLAIANYINGIATALSIFGSLFMIFIYFKEVTMRTFPMKLVISLVFATLFYSISNILLYFNDNGGVCDVEGFVRTSGELASIVWALMLSYITYDNIRKLRNDWETKYWKLVLVIVTITFLLPTAALISGAAGGKLTIKRSGLVCGLNPEVFDLTLVYVPMVICLFTILIYSIKTKIKLNKLMEGNLEDNQFGMIFWYPIILALLWFPNMVDSVLDAADLNVGYGIFLLHFTTSRLLGVVNALVFGRYYLQHRARDQSQGRIYRNISMTESKTSNSEYRFLGST